MMVCIIRASWSGIWILGISLNADAMGFLYPIFAFCPSFKLYMDDGTIIVPGYLDGIGGGGGDFQLARSTCHVSASASNLHHTLPPGSLLKALDHRNPDWQTWLASYKEEYDGLCSNVTLLISSAKMNIIGCVNSITLKLCSLCVHSPLSRLMANQSQEPHCCPWKF
jgi:hypothetical protein